MIKKSFIISGFYEPNDKSYENRILVYCHNNPIIPHPKTKSEIHLAGYNTHWLSEFFNEKIKLKGLKNLWIETIDILPKNPEKTIFDKLIENKRVLYNHIQTDGFDTSSLDSFINTHYNIYDIVFMPDCGGPWSDAWNIKDNEQRVNKIISILMDVLKIVKPNGWLIFSKILYKDDIDNINKELKKLNINVSIGVIKYIDVNIDYMQIIKN